MDNTIKSPCNECPFTKTSLRGWLGGENVKDTIDCVNKEIDFSCHKTREDDKTLSYCKGYLIFAKKLGKLPKYNHSLTNALSDISLEEVDKSQVMGYREFINHHTL